MTIFADNKADNTCPGQTYRIAVSDFSAWRTAARCLLHHNISPNAIDWVDGDVSTDHALFAADTALPHTPEDLLRKPIQISRHVLEKLSMASRFSAPDRWQFLYQVIWRFVQGEQEVMSAGDVDGQRLHQMLKAVRREIHDMHAYVRFRERSPEADAPRFVAWFEPAHDVLDAVGDHFANRMGKNSWIIATPEATLACNGQSWAITAPVSQNATRITDDNESLWLTYYRSIFNPARLNIDVMHSHVRQRFWKNMPESAVLPEMMTQARLGGSKTGQLAEVGQRDGATIADKAAEVVIARGKARNHSDH